MSGKILWKITVQKSSKVINTAAIAPEASDVRADGMALFTGKKCATSEVAITAVTVVVENLCECTISSWSSRTKCTHEVVTTVEPARVSVRVVAEMTSIVSVVTGTEVWEVWGPVVEADCTTLMAEGNPEEFSK